MSIKRLKLGSRAFHIQGASLSEFLILSSIAALIAMAATQLGLIAIQHYHRLIAALNFYYRLDLSLELLKRDLMQVQSEASPSIHFSSLQHFSSLLPEAPVVRVVQGKMIVVDNVLEKRGELVAGMHLGTYHFKPDRHESDDSPLTNNHLLVLDLQSEKAYQAFVITKQNKDLYAFDSHESYVTKGHDRLKRNFFNKPLALSWLSATAGMHQPIKAATLSSYEYYLKPLEDHQEKTQEQVLYGLYRKNRWSVNELKAHPALLLPGILAWEVSDLRPHLPCLKIKIKYRIAKLFSKQPRIKEDIFFLKISYPGVPF